MYLKSFILPIQYEDKLMAEQSAKNGGRHGYLVAFIAEPKIKREFFIPKTAERPSLKDGKYRKYKKWKYSDKFSSFYHRSIIAFCRYRDPP